MSSVKCELFGVGSLFIVKKSMSFAFRKPIYFLNKTIKKILKLKWWLVYLRSENAFLKLIYNNTKTI